MCKKGIAIIMGTVLMISMLIPAYASSATFSIGSVSGKATLSKYSTYAIGQTSFGAGNAVTATRKVKVTLKCTYGGNTYYYSDNAFAVTNSANYNSTTATVRVYRPSSSYTVSGATSVHNVTMGGKSVSKSLSVE